MGTAGDFEEAIDAFLKSVPRDWEFPWGGETEIATAEELRLADAIEAMAECSAVEGESVRRMTRLEAYDALIFAVRIAVLAVRTESPGRLRSSVFMLMHEGDQVDWRDMLGAMSLVNCCARRLNIDLVPIAEGLGVIATERKRNLIAKGYFPRASQDGAPECFGFIAEGDGAKFHFTRKSPILTRSEMVLALKKSPR